MGVTSGHSKKVPKPLSIVVVEEYPITPTRMSALAVPSSYPSATYGTFQVELVGTEMDELTSPCA